MARNDEAMASWPLLGRPDGEGRWRFGDLDASVRESIRIILQTAPGERLRRPGFGVGLERFLDQPNTLVTRNRIREAIVEGLTRWEPRLRLEEVEVAEVEGRPGTVRIEIRYRLRRTGERRSQGITMELQG